MNDPDDQYSPEETARRRDDAIRRALNTRPTPQKEMVGKVGRAQSKRSARSRSIKKGKDDSLDYGASARPLTLSSVALHEVAGTSTAYRRRP
jgi:hypothetical protein